jgi:hypothetical protein
MMARRNRRARVDQLNAAWHRRRHKVADPDPIRRNDIQARFLDLCGVTRKICYGTERRALRALQAFAEERVARAMKAGLPEPRRVESRVYTCPHCGMWHTTSQEDRYAGQSREELAEVSQAPPEGLQQDQRGEDHERPERASEQETQGRAA